MDQAVERIWIPRLRRRKAELRKSQYRLWLEHIRKPWNDRSCHYSRRWNR